MSTLISITEVTENGVTYVVEQYDNGAVNKYVKQTPLPEAVSTIITPYAFRARFTVPEMVGVYTSAKTDPILEMFLDDIRTAQEINLAESRVTDGLDYLMGLGLLTSERKAAILAV